MALFKALAQKNEKSLVFMATKRSADQMAEELQDTGLKV